MSVFAVASYYSAGAVVALQPNALAVAVVSLQPNSLAVTLLQAVPPTIQVVGPADSALDSVHSFF